MSQEAYLGDGAYIKSAPFSEADDNIVIYTHDGFSVTNEVHLGVYEIERLIVWLRETGRLK